MSWVDYGVLVLYLVGCFVVGARFVSRSRTQGLKDYFLGERDIPAWAVMISIVATETSAVTFLSVPGNSGRPGGNMTFLQLAMGYIVARVIVTFLLLPSYFRGDIETAYQVPSGGSASRRSGRRRSSSWSRGRWPRGSACSWPRWSSARSPGGGSARRSS